VASQHLLDGGNLSLDFDNQEGRGRFMKRQNVDRAALSVFGIRDFDCNVPAKMAQDRRDLTDELGMALIKDPIQVGPAPPDIERGPGIQGGKHAANRAERQMVEVPALDQ
jgi:hypothetical protein